MIYIYIVLDVHAVYTLWYDMDRTWYDMDRTNVPIIHVAVHDYIAKKLHPSDVFTWGPIPGNSETDTQPTSDCTES